MNVLVTGASGFLGKTIVRHLSKLGHNIYPITRDNVDLLCRDEVEKYFTENNIEIVFHTAITGGRRTKRTGEKNGCL